MLSNNIKISFLIFFKDALIRRFGEDFYVELDDMANFHYENAQDK
jgi:hypothetical protein